MVVTIIIEHCDEGQSPVTVSPQPSYLSHLRDTGASHSCFHLDKMIIPFLHLLLGLS